MMQYEVLELNLKNVKVMQVDGLLVEFAKENNIKVIVRGICTFRF